MNACCLVLIHLGSVRLHCLQVRKAGSGITVVPSGGSPAHVILGDIAACNAIVHVIDTVLLPSNLVIPCTTCLCPPPPDTRTHTRYVLHFVA
jgi:Fasciclin domain